MIGDKIIFPCAGYTDMCMTAGFADAKCEEGVYVKPTSPIAVTNFEISTPICLNDTQGTDFQVCIIVTDYLFNLSLFALPNLLICLMY